MVLYLLGILGRDSSDASVRRAWGFLVKTQRADGSWFVPRQAIGKAPKATTIFTHWGTAWATIGLLRTLPK